MLETNAEQPHQTLTGKISFRDAWAPLPGGGGHAPSHFLWKPKKVKGSWKLPFFWGGEGPENTPWLSPLHTLTIGSGAPELSFMRDNYFSLEKRTPDGKLYGAKESYQNGPLVKAC